MSFSTTSDNNNDILWIETRVPAIASIYYNLHLRHTHALYCPDDHPVTAKDRSSIEPVKQKHVRDLARDILRVIDSNNYKKLALFFIQPVGPTKINDLVRFLLKRRSRLTLSHLTLPCSSIQHHYLSGWSYSLDEAGLDSTWRRQCRAQSKVQEEHPSTLIPATNRYTELEFNQPFALASQPFKKKALFVYITQEMLLLQPNMVSTIGADMNSADAFQLNPTALMAIQGWMDAVSVLPSEYGNSLILIADEKSFFSGSDVIKLQGLKPEEQERTLNIWRQHLRASIQSMAVDLPIYLLLNRFTTLKTQTTLTDQLAWIQHRHYICIPNSMLLTWWPYRPTAAGSLFTQLDQVVLTSNAKYDRLKWKTEFTELLQKVGATDPSIDPLHYVSPEALRIDAPPLSAIDQYTTPLINSKEPSLYTIIHESEASFHHSVSFSNEQVARSWVTKVQRQQQHLSDSKEDKEDTIKDNARSNIDEDDRCDPDVHDDLNNTGDLDDERALKLENLADSLDHDIVRDYISNSGAFSRGENLLHIWDSTEHSWQDETDLAVIFGKAKGTSDTPYQVYATLNHDDGDHVVKGGFCSCPVGRAGRCKHVTALLLRFMINVDDFGPAQETLVMPIVDGDSGAKPSGAKPSGAKPVAKSSPHTTPKPTDSTLTPSATEDLCPDSLANLTAPAGPALSPENTGTKQPDDNTNTKPVPNTLTPPSSAGGSSLPLRRRILPWEMDQHKNGRKTKKRRATKASTSLTPATSQLTDPSSPPLENVQPKTSAVNKSSANRTPRTRTKKKATRADDLENSDAEPWDSDAQLQITDTPKTARRSTRKKTTTQPMYNIDDSIMLEEEDDTKAPPRLHLEQKTGAPPPKSAPAVVDLSLISDDNDIDDQDDMEITCASHPRTETTSSNPSPITFMQKSSLSLPMTDLALMSSKCLGSETEDEDDEQIPQQQKPNPMAPLRLEAVSQRSATSDLFDELDL